MLLLSLWFFWWILYDMITSHYIISKRIPTFKNPCYYYKTSIFIFFHFKIWKLWNVIPKALYYGIQFHSLNSVSRWSSYWYSFNSYDSLLNHPIEWPSNTRIEKINHWLKVYSSLSFVLHSRKSFFIRKRK